MIRRSLLPTSLVIAIACLAWSCSAAPASSDTEAPAPVATPAICDVGFHDCGGTCSDDTSPATCGASCTPCLVGAHAEPRCDGTVCRKTCLPFYADCDHVEANGCEANLLVDAANCGFCGRACDGLACVNGACKAVVASPRIATVAAHL